MNSISQLKVAICVTGDTVQRISARAAFPEIRVWFLALTWWLTTLCNSNYRGMWHSLLASMDPGIHVAYRHTSKQNIRVHKIKKITALLEMAWFCLLKVEVCYQELFFWGGVGSILYQTANEIIISFNIYYLPFWVKYYDVP